MDSTAILARLIAFPTVSRDPNLDLVAFARDLLAGAGIASTLVHDPAQPKANLFATVGPGDGGVMLSGHTDVVPVDGQDWSVPPFALTARDGRLYGRGAADMKGFVACALAAMLRAARAAAAHAAAPRAFLRRGGRLPRRAQPARVLADAPARPRLCIVGEPTGMAVATGHKGKLGPRAPAPAARATRPSPRWR